MLIVDKETLLKAEKAYTEADRLYFEIAKPIIDQRREALAALAEITPGNHHFQDEDGIVYMLVPKKGQWIDFSAFEMKRTQRVAGETNVVARKTAEELGYEPFKPAKPEEEK